MEYFSSEFKVSEKMKAAVLFLCLILLTGCKKDENPVEDNNNISHVFEAGTYNGKFSITSNGIEESGNVTFIFTDSTYSCVPKTPLLPPLGSGIYEKTDKTIRLRDTAVHPANFDWSLILNGFFDYTFNGTSLKMTQNDSVNNRNRVIDLVRLN